MKKTISVPAIRIESLQVKIEGISPLIVKRFGAKPTDAILTKHLGKASNSKKEIRDPEAECEDCLYKLPSGDSTGFPAHGFKAALVRGAKSCGFNMTDIRGAVFVNPQDGDLVKINGDWEMRTDNVRLSSGVANITFRPCYYDWGATLDLSYNAEVLSPDQLINIVNTAGFACGVGEWRPQKSNSGIYGRWRVVEG